jgi:MFS family permease
MESGGLCHCRILSDCIPIKGRRRIPYLVIATVLSLVPWLILGLNATLRSSRWHLMIVLTVQNLGSAMADVVVDAMIAEAVRLERYGTKFEFHFHSSVHEI